MLSVADEYIDLEEVLSKCFMLAFKYNLNVNVEILPDLSNLLGQLAWGKVNSPTGPGAATKKKR